MPKYELFIGCRVIIRADGEQSGNLGTIYNHLPGHPHPWHVRPLDWPNDVPGIAYTAAELMPLALLRARIEAEYAADPFFAILDQIEEDEAEFADGMAEGYMLRYDRTPEQPALTCSGIYAYFFGDDLTQEHDPRWLAGRLAGWMIAFAENNQANFWASEPAPEGVRL